MRRLATLLVPVLALSACYPGYRSGPGSDSYRYDSDRWYDAADVPLAARVEQVGSGLGIRLNRPAYVAMFEIIPGQGVGLYYPAYGAERGYFPSGFSSLPLHGARYYDSYFTGLPARYSRGEPRFYFLVASRRPLRSITRFQRADGAIRSVLGLTAYNTLNYRRVMDDLVEAVVPLQNDEDWTTDVLAVWPQDYGYYAYGDRYQRVYCGDGTTELLPAELALWGCRRQQRPIVVRAPRTADGGTTPPPAAGDSVRAPGRHRPQPADGADAGTGADDTGRRAVPQRRPGTPEAAEPAAPRTRPGVDAETPATPGEDGGDARTPRVEPRERPRAESPRPEPRETPRTEPRTESPKPTPRSESPRSEPRTESPRPAPRAESPRSEPRTEAPRPAPVRNDPPPRAEPARSSEPASAPAPRSEPRPAAPPAQR